MGIGLGVFLLALGAILTWAVEFEVSGLDISVIGVILMIAGAISLIMGVIFLTRRRAITTAVPRERLVDERVEVRRDRDVV